MQLGRFLRTVRHLRLRQVIGRLRFRLPARVPGAQPAPPRRAWSGPWAAPARREASLAEGNVLRFLDESHALSEVGWDAPWIAKLWRYNQHYFDDLNALGAQTRRAAQHELIARWIAGNPAARGTGWEPYPTSLRVVNWIKAAQSGLQLDAAALDSLARQVRWLERRLEWHLLGNHLFANGKALVFAGLFFEGPEADRWLAKGLAIVAPELREQVLADGGHFERSPMYHALALEDLLDLVNAIRAAGVPADFARDAAARAPAMLAWLRALSHPNGELAHFNDCANGIAPARAELEAHAQGLGFAAPPPAGSTWLRDSGYARIECGPAVALLDLAPIGPDYLPGHAHADTLSFEVSLGERRLIVNGGTSCYGEGERRQRERGTAAHSTVQVAGRDSSEIWAGFRVGRRARVHDAQVSGDTASAWHDGYRFLPGAPRTAREWRFDERGMQVRDRVAPATPAVARYLLAPGLELRKTDGGAWQVADATRAIARVIVERGAATIEPAHYAARFGEPEAVQCLAVALDRGEAATRWIWQDDAHPVPDR